MAQPFALSPLSDGTYIAYLTTGERLFLVRAAADVVELLGEEDTLSYGESELLEDTIEDPFAEFDGRRTSQQAPPPDPFGQADQTSPGAETIAENLERVLEALNTRDVPLAPTDPAVRRLLPDASLDPEVAAEFRKFTDFDLREQKVQRLLMLSGLLTEVDPSSDDNEHLPLVVRSDEAEAISAALGDIRLVLGERLDLRFDEDSELLHNFVMSIQQEMLEDRDEDDLDEETERRYIMGILFELAGYLQESLVECMLDDLRAKRGAQGL